MKEKIKRLQLDHLSTRERLLLVGTMLFSQRGVAGVTVREIASLAKVNGAAINYHFKSKDELFLEILRSAYTRVSLQFQKIVEEREYSFEELSLLYFRTLLAQKWEFYAIFRMHIDYLTSHYEHQGPPFNQRPDGEIGPPGSFAFLQVLEREVKKSLSKQKKNWVVRTMIIHIYHHLLLFAREDQLHQQRYDFSTKSVENGIRDLARILIADL